MDDGWKKTDLVKFLGLDQLLTPQEIEDLTDQLNQEIWFRVLNEEVPKILAPEKFEEFTRKIEQEKDLEKIAEILESIDSTIKLEGLVESVALAVKREYIVNFLHDLKEKFVRENEPQKAASVDLVVAELQAGENPDFELINKKMENVLNEGPSTS